MRELAFAEHIEHRVPHPTITMSVSKEALLITIPEPKPILVIKLIFTSKS